MKDLEKSEILEKLKKGYRIHMMGTIKEKIGQNPDDGFLHLIDESENTICDQSKAYRIFENKLTCPNCILDEDYTFYLTNSNNIICYFQKGKNYQEREL